ncbi:Aminopeptidase 2 mitochondrial [Vanrija albida]|uniref:Aminopeptidase n=1 Tax=Vanrija albida TaxID=181172 RepID=A0ABR3PWD5_9TREE
MASSSAPAGDYRLPTNVYPAHYDLAIQTDLAASPPSFSGAARISLDVLDDTTSVVFHLHPSLKVTDVRFGPAGGAARLPLSAISVNAENERATVDISSLGGAKAGSKAQLLLKWQGKLGSMMGYYRSDGDPDKDGKRPLYALTQFAPTSARRAFPSWDEPLLKSTFAISMVARSNETVLSNMSAASSGAWKAGSLDPALEPEFAAGDDWVVTTFDTTPKISTYLVAYACGEFGHLSTVYHSNLTGKTIPLKIYVTPNQLDQAQFGLDVAKWALPVYEELFEIAYPLPKLDTLVAHDFEYGAMENWGLITGRTTAYLCNPRSSLEAIKRIGQTQCHEVAHMWFGNIVTMKWWDNLWLNEAFATLMGSIVLPERIWPEWKMTSQFINDHWARALSLDARRSSHPIEVDCSDPNQIGEIFDAISYSKGASVLRMLKGVVGDDKFFKGVSLYLKKHLYGNATTRDLWAGIGEAVGQDIGEVMNNWVLKIGFPVVSVEELGGGEVKLTQHRFLITGDVKDDEDETVWWIPLEIKAVRDGKAAVDHDAVLNERSATFKVDSDVFKLNAETVGVYRVMYSAERLAKLGEQAQQFSVDDRVGLVSDAAALTAAGYTKTSGALNLVTALAPHETDYLPFSGIAGFLSGLAGIWWEDEAVRSAVDKLRVELFRPVVDRLGYDHGEKDEPTLKQLRTLAVSVAASGGDKDVVAELKARFQPFLEHGDDSRIPPDLQGTVFRQAVAHGGVAEYEKLLAVYNSPPNPSTKLDALAAIASAKEPALLDRSFKLLADPQAVKDQDVASFLSELAANRTARRRTVEYFEANWDALNARFSSSMGLKGAIAGVLGTLSSKADLEHATEFVAARDVRKYKNSFAQALEGIEARSNWLLGSAEDTKAWFKKHS